MDDAQKARLELLGKFRDDVLRRQLSNTENFDKAVLSLSTAFLGFSLAFLKDFTPFKEAVLAPLLPISWALFGLSIVATITSFFASQRGLAIQLEYAERYYLAGEESYLTKSNPAAAWTDRINYASAVSFVFAVIVTIVFTSANLASGGNMSEKNVRIIEGATVPTMQRVPGNVGISINGAQIPTMQQVPAPQAPASGGQSNPSTGTPTGGSSTGSK